MGYADFAYYYDQLNGEADYDLLASHLHKHLGQTAGQGSVVLDLGCGTGEISLRLSRMGYDMIAIDASAEMLSVFQNKLAGQRGSILLLQQDLATLALHGAAGGAVSTFDTFNHMEKRALENAFARISLFLAPGASFLFDVNSPYKHKHILADNCFEIEMDDQLTFVWQNTYDEAQQATAMELTLFRGDTVVFREWLREYAYSLSFWEGLLEKNGFSVKSVVDGESFAALTPKSPRYFIEAIKI